MAGSSTSRTPEKLLGPVPARALVQAFENRGTVVYVDSEELRTTLSERLPERPVGWQLVSPPPVSGCDPPKPDPPVIGQRCPESMPGLSALGRRPLWRRIPDFILALLRRFGLYKPAVRQSEPIRDVELSVFRWDDTGVVQIVSPSLVKELERAKERVGPAAEKCISWSSRLPVEVQFRIACDPPPPVVSGGCCEPK